MEREKTADSPQLLVPPVMPLPSLTSASCLGQASSRRNTILDRIDKSNFQSSTKIEAVREELANMLDRDPSAKCILFSQFTSMLDLVHFRLNQVGIKTVRLMGSMTLQQRDKAIADFTHDVDVKCFLMSLKVIGISWVVSFGRGHRRAEEKTEASTLSFSQAGGVALNLTAASHVILMDPWWNPGVRRIA